MATVISPSICALFHSARRISALIDPSWFRSTLTSTCTGAPSNTPCAARLPLGVDGRPLTFAVADISPLGEPRTERLDVNCASPAKAVIGPASVPDAFSVPASAGDTAFRSETSRAQRARRLWRLLPAPPGAGLDSSPPAVSDAARPVNFRFSRVIARSVSAPDNCSVALSPTTPDQISVPGRSAALASRITCVAPPSSCKRALRSALPVTFCPAIAASSVKLGRRNSSVALRLPLVAAVGADACNENNRCDALRSSGRVAASSLMAASTVMGESSSSCGRGPGIRSPVMTACNAAFPESAFASPLRAASCAPPGRRNRSMSICASACGALRLPCQRPCTLARSHARSARGARAAESNAKSRSADRSSKSMLPSACPRRAPAAMDSSRRSAERGPLKFTVAASAPRPGSCRIFSKGPPAGSCSFNAASIRFRSNRNCKS